jgi:hypothetical protein
MAHKIKKNKKGFQMSFAWLFAIIAGVFILFLTIYGVTRLIDTGGDITSAKTGAEIGILLNPLETGFESGRTVLLTMPVETRIHNKYSTSGNFGVQIIQISQKSYGKWSQTDVDISFPNKYIFSDSVVEGKKFFIFSKPFNFPFKVADVIYLTSSEKDYCFINAPERIEEELSDLNQQNLLVEDCSEESVRICFETEIGCDINVDVGRREVEKSGQTMFFETDALMYAAIFSDKSIYEYQIKRLMQRTNELLLLYDTKAVLLSNQACPQDVNLFVFKNIVNNVQDSEDLTRAANAADDLERENEYATCKLW